MKRRQFLAGLASAPLIGLAVKALGTTTHPSLNKPWPLDIREGFKNVQHPSNIRVYLDGVLQGGVVAASPETGHALAYVLRKDKLPNWHAVTVECTGKHDRHMHVPTDVGSAYCLPLEIRRGKVRLEYV